MGSIETLVYEDQSLGDGFHLKMILFINKHLVQLTIEVQNLLYLSALPSPPEHSGAGHELLNTKSGATGLALSSLGRGQYFSMTVKGTTIK